MPVATQIGLVVGNHDEVERSRWDRQIAPGADVVLHRLIGLDGTDRYVEKSAHAITAMMATTVRTIITMSTTDLSCSRNGLNPTPKR